MFISVVRRDTRTTEPEGGVGMEHIVYDLLKKFEAGKISRREVARSLSVAASAATLGAVP